MRLFEKHRQQRHATQKKHNAEMHLIYKSQGGREGGQVELNNGEDARDVLDLMQTLYKKDNE